MSFIALYARFIFNEHHLAARLLGATRSAKNSPLGGGDRYVGERKRCIIESVVDDHRGTHLELHNRLLSTYGVVGNVML